MQHVNILTPPISNIATYLKCFLPWTYMVGLLKLMLREKERMENNNI